MLSRRNFIRTSLAGSVAAVSACGPKAPTISALETFRTKFNGKILSKGDAQFENWRQDLSWQMDVPERRPDMIVRPKTIESIQNAVHYARDAGMKVVCKSGGHNVAGSFYRDSGMLLDLVNFNDVGQISDTGEIWVGPAAWSWHLAQSIEKQGYSFPYAHCASVPMGGYLLGGGVGINGDAWGGIGCHSVTGLKILLPDGNIVIADENQNSDLFWAARGAGTGFFGAVLEFRLKLYPAARDIKEQYFFYPVDMAGEISAWLENVAKICPKNVELLLLMGHRPPPMAGPSKREQKMCMVRLAAFGKIEGEADLALALISDLIPPTGTLFAMPTVATTMEKVLIGSVDPNVGLGFGRYNVETIWSNDLASSMEALVEPFVESPYHKAHVLSTPRHGAALRPDAAFSSLGSSFVGIYSIWDDEKEDANNVTWTHEAAAAMAPTASGHYINEIDGFAFPEKISECFSSDANERLEKLRSHYDPNGLFHGFPGA